ncbi:MAG: hypothetical protein Harvfovirus69_6, partial [Harvfovirus sp.]
MSSIYNFINTRQRNLYNCLFQNKLLAVEYYGSLVAGAEVGIGLTLRHTYELFVSNFYSNCIQGRTNFYDI